jgi:hypothetical protein
MGGGESTCGRYAGGAYWDDGEDDGRCDPLLLGDDDDEEEEEEDEDEDEDAWLR